MRKAFPEAGWRALVPATLAYAALTLVYTYPAVRRLGTHIFGGPWDGPMFLWNTWWAPRALFRLGTNPLFTRHLFYPDGTSLVINTHCLLPALVSAPLQGLFGLVPAYNLMVLLTFVLAGLGAFLLTFDLTGDRRVAFVSGLIFAFGHVRISQIAFFNLIQTELLVFFAWALWRSIRRASWGWSAIAGIFGACLLYTDYNLFFLSGYFGAACALAALVAAVGRGAPVGPLLARCGVLVAVILFLGMPLLVLMVQEVGDEGNYYTTQSEATTYNESVPLERFIIRGPLAGRVHGTPHGINEASYLGTVAMVLALCGLLAGRRSRTVQFWAVLAFVFLVIALGPRLNLSGSIIERGGSGLFAIPLPFAILREIPIVREVRTAHRYALVGSMALAVLAGFGAKALLVRLEQTFPRRRWAPATACLGASVLIFFDFAQIPFPKFYRLPEVPPAMHAIAFDSREVCVLEYPAGRWGYPAFSYFETIHGKPVYLDGQTARTSPQMRDRWDASALFTTLRRIYDGNPPAPEEIERLAPAIREEARANEIGWVVLAWTDVNRMTGKADPVRPEAMEAADALIRRALPVEEVFGSATPEDVARFDTLGSDDRRSFAFIYRTYRITRPDPGT